MIDQHQRELRRAAARKFFESLDQLQERLQTTDNQPINQPISPPTPPPADKGTSESFQFDLNAFEQAAADIEAYIQQKHAHGG
ncbi:MAG: hypothetical protein WCA35_17970 [Kovacikia sp.]